VPAPANGQTAPSTDADNTAMNTRDRSPSALTPMDQGNSMTDIKITQKIRQSVVGDSTMSFNAKNVKIITKDAHVVLRGTVNTMAERQAIEAKAKATAGVADVNNQIDVKK
jgi:hyperosmotically inducible protein